VNQDQKIIREKEKKKSGGKKRVNFFVKESEAIKVIEATEMVLVLVYKSVYMSTNESLSSLPHAITSIIQEFKDVFLKETLGGLPPLRGIEY
jgi:hypothetical protein